MIKTGIFLSEEDRLDINLAIEIIRTSYFVLDNLEGLENLEESQAKAMYEGACDTLIEGKIMMHNLRKDFSKKYNIPYNFISKDGEIFLGDSNGC